MRTLSALLLGVAGLVTTLPAQAAAVFHLTGPFDATFTLPTSPTNIVPEELGDPNIFGMSGTANVDGFDHPIHFHFYTDTGGGGLDFLLEDVLDLYSPAYGPSVFSGTVFNPTFLAGDYSFEDYYLPGVTYDLSITITPDVPAVPEPASWAMMIAGFALAGGALRGRNRGWRLRFA